MSDPFHPVEGGSANDYDYTSGDPVNGLDLNGEARVPADRWDVWGGNSYSAQRPSDMSGSAYIQVPVRWGQHSKVDKYGQFDYRHLIGKSRGGVPYFQDYQLGYLLFQTLHNPGGIYPVRENVYRYERCLYVDGEWRQYAFIVDFNSKPGGGIIGVRTGWWDPVVQ